MYAIESKLANVVTGTGVLEADQQFDVFASVMGKVISAPFKEGQTIKKGDILYKIDQTDILNNIAKATLAIEKTQLAYNQNADNINKLSVHSKISGTITNLYIHDGDMVVANGKIADVVDNHVMVLKAPFIDETTNGIYQGQSATVTIVGTSYTVNGTVKKVTSGHMTSSDGSVYKIVEINVPNPGTLVKGDKGTAVIGNVACNDAGIFDYSNYETVIAEVAGKVKNLNISVGDRISGGAIATLENDALTTQQQQNSLSVKDARITLDNLNSQLEKYNIASTIDGIAIKKNIEKDDNLTAGTINNMATIADLSKIIFNMNVDELDVSKISVGQSVSITADAMPEKAFSGKVDFVSSSGTIVNGVSLYKITVVVENPQGLMPGMNVNAKISIDTN
jgi:HlyD family secretion protein